MRLLNKLCTIVLTIGCLFFLLVPEAWAFCGFYVSKADATLFNQASQVIIAREGNRTILTMANDFQGEVQEFAVVVPVPVTIKADQVKVGNAQILQRLDAFSAPRLVEYFDANPCAVPRRDLLFKSNARSSVQESSPAQSNERTLGVTIEEKFTVGEYDILVLSAKESAGLETWLNQNGYRIPPGAREVLRPYIRENMKFFVAKVNLEEFAKSDSQLLRPLLIAYESPKFILPIRLGMLNAKGDQDLIAYLLSPQGRVELTNYRTVKIPTDTEIPLWVKNEFGRFYQAMFQHSYTKEGKNVALMEYAWNMGNCDPCAAEPLSAQELKEAGVFWNPDKVFITRLHVRYSRRRFPEDLKFRETSNQDLFQGRYILNHPFRGKITCPEIDNYQRRVRQRQEREVQNLARLTNWDIQEIRRKAAPALYRPDRTQPQKFWEGIWAPKPQN